MFKFLSKRVQVIQEITQRFPENELKKSFTYQYELSGLYITNQSYVKGLEYALIATHLTKNLNCKISAYINAIICAESLDLPRDQLLSKIYLLLAKIEIDDVNPLVIRELSNFQLREYFRLGKFTKIFSLQNLKYQKHIILYQAWFQAFPHIKFKKLDAPLLTYENNAYDVNRDYKLDTLLHCFRETVESTLTVHSIIDRFYLWTWRFFSNPTLYPFQNLQSLVDSIDLSTAKDKMTSEDKLMYINSLFLLSSLDSSLIRGIKKIEKLLSPLSYHSYPYLQYERKFIDLYLLKRTKHSDFNVFLKAIKKEELFKNSNILYNKYIKSSFQSSHGLYIIDKQLKEMDNKIPKKVEWVFNPISGTFFLTNSKMVIKSDILANALSYIFYAQKNEINVEDFFSFVFKIRDFDPVNNYRMLFNIIQRLNIITNDHLNIKYKNKKLFFHINKELFFHEDSLLHEIDFSSNQFHKKISQWLENLSKKSININTPTKSPASVFLTHKRMTRNDIQNSLNTTKSSSLRIIAEWKKQKLIRHTGKGPATLYELS
jgi:hypothetical protein